MNFPSNWFFTIKNSRVAQLIGGVFVIIFFIALVIAGMGLLPILIIICLIVLAILFGSIRELAGSIVIGFLTKIYLTEVKTIFSFWTDSQSLKQTFDYIETIDTVQLIIILFFFIYTISIITGSIKIFNISVNSEHKK
ncbi:MAG: hypothetical protein PHR00_03835 [Patescibacteria group bacterium]|nr:hypothetical protein [Patescibacteria group bacterium]